ncbi:hypothetical protein RGUI_1038 [Rhodovulum sp. P5]|nr:hypothetical protein RGUI_1038 [Rhodovulum sp. P5]
MGRIRQLEAWYRRVYIDGDMDAVGDLFTENMQEQGLMPGMQVNPAELQVFATALVHLVEDPSIRIVKAIESDDWLCALIETGGTRPDDGRPVRAMGQLMARFEGDRIAEAYNSFDFIHLFEQLGLLPEDSVAIGMSGQKIG